MFFGHFVQKVPPLLLGLLCFLHQFVEVRLNEQFRLSPNFYDTVSGLGNLANGSHQFGCRSFALDHFRAAFVIVKNFPEPSFVALLVGKVGRSHQLLPPVAFYRIGGEVGMDSFSHFAVQLL